MLFVLVATANANTPLTGHTIGLDAGHGNGETGAVGYCGDEAVPEYLVNEAVRNELALLIEGAGGIPYYIQQEATRKARVEDAEANGSEVLISIHHNGSTNTEADYTQSFVTQKNDKDLAKVLHPAIVRLIGIDDRGIKNDGYGMTVYGSIPGVLTESYFITNQTAACDFINYRDNLSLDTRIHREARGMFEGLLMYFNEVDRGGGDTGGGNCSPGKQKQDKC